MSVNFSNTTVQQIYRTYVGDYVVSTIWIDNPHLLPFYETIIFSTATIPDDKDILNGMRVSCVFKTNALKMHKNSIEMVKKVMRYNFRKEDDIIEQFTMLNVNNGFHVQKFT